MRFHPKHTNTKTKKILGSQRIFIPIYKPLKNIKIKITIKVKLPKNDLTASTNY